MDMQRERVGSSNKSSKKEDQADKTNTELEPKGQPQPIVARIQLWTTRPANVQRSRSHDSGNDSGDHSDDDDNDAEDVGFSDVELDENAQLEQRLRQADLPEYVRKSAAKEMQKLRRTPSFMSDYAVTRSYLELIAEMPWNAQSAEVIDLRKCKRDLDGDHYGMHKMKERVLQYLAVRKLKQQSTYQQQQRRPEVTTTTTTYRSSGQPILMFVGPPGTGKTSIAQSIAASLGRKLQRISLGGVADQSAIRGHRRTYIGAMPGRIVQGLKQAGVNNPVFLLDEIDKMSAGPQGDPAGALLEVLDPEQNHTFTDHYLNLAFDLSRVLFIATANSTDGIPAALLDRMEVIQMIGYSHEEKFNIARRHLVPKQVVENGLRADAVVFRDDAIHKIISHYAREAGVRTLERRIGTICRVVAVRTVDQQSSAQASNPSSSSCDLDHDHDRQPAAVVVDAATLESFLGPAVYDRENNARANLPGVSIGLAWTAAGGEITFVEAEIFEGSKSKEGLVLTGQLGSVMRESAMLALNWVRANLHLYEALPPTLGRDLAANTVHVHFPAGAVGKDGPSAGVTVVAALMSLCSGLSVAPDLAMTGEITLRGVVLKVGGVKAKVLAAHRAGIKRVVLPARNESDLGELAPAVRDKMQFHFASTVHDVLRFAFDGRLLARSDLLDSSHRRQHQNLFDPSRGLTSKL